jgi:hypothetical protein
MKSRRALSTTVFALAVAALAVPSIGSAKKQNPFDEQYRKSSGAAKSAQAAAATPKGMQEWGSLTKDAQDLSGLFRVYQKKDAWYLTLRKDQLEKPYLMSLTIGRGIGSNFVLGGLMLGEDVVSFRRRGDQIQLVKDVTRFTAPSDSALMRAVELSFAPSVVHSFKIESERGDSLLVDLGGLVLSDYADVVQGMKEVFDAVPRIDDKRSSLGALKVFPKNVEMEGELTIVAANRDKVWVRTSSDGRYIPVTMHYSLSDLPSEPYVPRLEDDRVGFFNTAYKDFTRDSHEGYMVRYINRWKLEKKDSQAAISEPVQPIVFYVENTIPEKWRPYIKEGIEEWNKAFEKAGFKNAIVAKDQPADSSWDAADVRYSTIRWIASSEPSFGAIGPSRVDPRTGQILDADILIEASVILGYKNSYRRWVGAETTAEALDGITPAQREALSRGDGNSRLLCSYGMGMYEGGNVLGLSLLAAGALAPGSPVPDEYIGQALRNLTLHEVGHTLGLRHNFQSSTSIPMDRLDDPSYVAEYGMAGSVMDYDTPWLGRDPARQKQFFGTTPGTYDHWAIRFGYTPTAASTPWDEKQLLAGVAAESSQPGHEYGTDEDTYPFDALDPRNNIYDLGHDPLAFAEQRTAHLASLWSNPNFEERVLAPGNGYPVMRRAMDVLLIQYTRQLSHGLKYVGGAQVSRAHYGDPGARDAFTPVPAAQQRAALAFLTKRTFAPDAFAVSKPLLNRLMADRFWDWEQNLFAMGRIDYPWYTRVLTTQTAVMKRLLSAPTVARLRESETRPGDPLTLSELFNEMTGAIWGEFGIGAPGAPARQNPAEGMRATNGPGTRRDLQRAYVDYLAHWVVDTTLIGTDDARALARLHLSRIDDACATRLAARGETSDVLRAHLSETRARIKRALEAQRESQG